ncbi:UDP-N-acetylmuramoyl-L-alanine--D-glutamate ligase [Coprothermobacteraceae bacterium]|nr:UDP-N-acetylmuramoyl-L-alanine--D-glutamate ligase [Coprothermobacteraceae bacterium]
MIEPGFSQRLNGKSVLILGYGRSGVSAERFLSERGARVYVYDDKAVKPELGKLVQDLPSDLDLAVTSPGFSMSHPVVVELTRRGIPLVGELELSYDASRWNYWIAVTGTNGKTTTTSLIGHLLRAAGFSVVVGGNIGQPVTSFLHEPISETVIVAEVSSFQLESVWTFRPQVAVFLNLTEDHLDRHGTMEAYFTAKAKLFENQQPQDVAVLNNEDEWVRQLIGRTRSRAVTFGVATGHVHWREGVLYLGEQPIATTSHVKLRGRHNLSNISAAVAAVSELMPSQFDYGTALSDFLAPPHRIEFVRQLNGVAFYDDSKGTNPDSTIVAIEAFEEPVVLILGGKNKGVDFTPLAKRILESTVKHVVLVGEAKMAIMQALQSVGFESFSVAETFENAVHTAFEAASPGDVVLLSPACASFDMFKNYEERGDRFKEIVSRL